MRRDSHRRRGVRRARSGGFGHRAVYAGAIVAVASLLAGFGVAGFYFGTFSHIFPQSSASGSQNAPYGVYYLSAGATYAGLLPNVNWTNASAGPCQNGTANGTNTLNNTSALNPINLSASNTTNSVNNTTTYICLNWVFNGNISYAWNFVNGTFMNFTNYTSWDNVSAPLNNTSVNNNTAATFNMSLENLTGNLNLSNSTINMTGCDPVWTNLSNISNFTNCRFYAANNNTTFMPHGGFYAPNGTWISEANNTSYDPWYWHPNQTGYLPSDQVYQATLEFANYTPANMTYQVMVDFGGATPVPQIYYVNTGGGGENETVTFVFDMSLAWTTAIPGNFSGAMNNTTTNFGFFSGIVAQISSASIIVSQCYVDSSLATVCPSATTPLFGSILS